jgi:hypothetical protein
MIPGYGAVALGDWIDDRNWTMVELQNGDTDTLDAFASGRSQQITGGTRPNSLWDTNVPGNGTSGLPVSWEALWYGFAFEPARCVRPAGNFSTLADFSDPVRLNTFFELDRRVFCRYVYNNKMYSEGHIADYPAGNGPSVTTTNPATEWVNNGIASPRDRLAMVLPVHETELLQYAFQITPVIALQIDQPASDGEGNETVLDLRVKKNGLIRRNVV